MAVATRSAQVLIVDDEQMVRRSLRKKLTREGYRCEEAQNAEEALAQMRGTPVDLVILDVMMPGKSGDKLLPEITLLYPETAVVMATAVADSDTIIGCMKNGAKDYICKPFKLDDVMASVERALLKVEAEMALKSHQRQLERRVTEQTAEIQKLSLGAIKSLVVALEAKDQYTAGHSLRVTDIALAIGKELNLGPQEMDNLRWGALLHDVGKLAVDPAIQNKPGKLSKDEYREMMMHIQVGPRIVGPVVDNVVADMIAHHHDHYDGTGFAQTLVGPDIPLGARILAVADSFDAMNSDRPYREALPRRNSLEEIRQGSGSQFDPVAAAAFLRLAARDEVPHAVMPA